MTTVEQSSSWSELATTGNADQETAPLILCPVCGAEARDHDRFCRQCGASQSSQCGGKMASSARATASYATGPLTQGDLHSPSVTSSFGRSDNLHRVSGSLITTITNGVSANTTDYPINRVARRVIAVLISIPIWLIIILLSPLDAYTAAKSVANQT